jgi:hypothetical protein
MTDIITFTAEELKETGTLRDQMAELFGQLGQLVISKDLLEEELAFLQKQKEAALQKYKELAVTEQNLVTKLTTKYGAGSLDLETGNFTPEK